MILVLIEDDSLARTLYLVLGQEGYQCETVGSIQDAYSSLLDRAYRTLIVDYWVGPKNTLGVVDFAYAGMQVIVLGFDEKLAQTLPQGVTFLQKPFDLETLLGLL